MNVARDVLRVNHSDWCGSSANRQQPLLSPRCEQCTCVLRWTVWDTMPMYFNELFVGFTSHRTALDLALFSNAEGPEDKIEDVIGGSGAGDFIQRPQSRIKIE